MIRAVLDWLRTQGWPLGLAVALHVVIGALLILGTSLHGANPNDMPGRGNEHNPIQAVVVKSSDYEAAENSIKRAQDAREAHARKLKAEAEQAERQRARAEHELAQLKQQKQSTASDVANTQKQLQSQSQQLQQLKAQADKMARQRKDYEDKIAKLKAEADKAKKQQAAEKAMLARAQASAEAARKAQVQQQMQAEQEAQMKRDRGNWVAAIAQRVTRNWIRPPNTPQGLDCFVKITQLPSGQVVDAVMERCNGDSVVQQSILTAVRKASPLPTPDNPDVFSRQITFEFQPDQS